MTPEGQLQSDVIELAQLLGWKVAHFRSVPVKRGDSVRWETPVQADGKGFPDLFMVRGERMIFAELKAGKNKMTPEQDAWMDALHYTGATLAVWFPHHWAGGVIEDTLRESC